MRKKKIEKDPMKVFKDKVSDALTDVAAEYLRGPKCLTSPHEGLAVIMEEFEELKQEVFKHCYDFKKIRREACQVAATALAMMVNIPRRSR